MLYIYTVTPLRQSRLCGEWWSADNIKCPACHRFRRADDKNIPVLVPSDSCLTSTRAGNKVREVFPITKV